MTLRYYGLSGYGVTFYYPPPKTISFSLFKFFFLLFDLFHIVVDYNIGLILVHFFVF